MAKDGKGQLGSTTSNISIETSGTNAMVPNHESTLVIKLPPSPIHFPPHSLFSPSHSLSHSFPPHSSLPVPLLLIPYPTLSHFLSHSLPLPFHSFLPGAPPPSTRESGQKERMRHLPPILRYATRSPKPQRVHARDQGQAEIPVKAILGF